MIPHVPRFAPFVPNEDNPEQRQKHSPSLEHLSKTSLDSESTRAASGTALRDTAGDDDRSGSSVGGTIGAGGGGERVVGWDDGWFGHLGLVLALLIVGDRVRNIRRGKEEVSVDRRRSAMAM